MKFSLRCKKSRYMCIHIALWKLDLANGYYVLVHIFAACTSSSTHPHISVLLYKWWTRPGFFQNWVLEVLQPFLMISQRNFENSSKLQKSMFHLHSIHFSHWFLVTNDPIWKTGSIYSLQLYQKSDWQKFKLD